MTGPARVGALALFFLLPGCASRTAFVDTPAGPATSALQAFWDAHHVSSPHSPLVDHADVEANLRALPEMFRVVKAGESVERRTIYHVTTGSGPMSVLLWSQMHGDEPTATSALLDLFAYLQQQPRHPVAERILTSLTLHVVPMLNPDGAERFTRRNAQGVDINRDALNLVTPEAQLLKRLRDAVDPAVGFNLHNQGWRTSVPSPGGLPGPAAISLLSVAYDEARSMSAGRLMTKKLAAVIRDAIEPLAANRIGRYDDGFEVRAFGDNITLWGTPVLLIETGPWPAADPDPALVRLNFIALVSALDALATGRVHAADPARYETLPENESGLFYQILRGGQVLIGDGQPPFRADVGIIAQRRVRGGGENRELWMATQIEDIGDLRTAGALFEIDTTGLVVAPAIVGLEPGSEIKLPDWSREQPATTLVAPGAATSLMLLRPLGNERYSVERVLPAQWQMGQQ